MDEITNSMCVCNYLLGVDLFQKQLQMNTYESCFKLYWLPFENQRRGLSSPWHVVSARLVPWNEVS